MNRGFFVTGTDTGVGKTCVSVALIRTLQAQGHVVVGMKPVASGCEASATGLVNEDALALRACASFSMPYPKVNPYAFEPAVAPHLAAQAEGVQIEIPVITETCNDLCTDADRVVVEGVGGWLVPINGQHTMADVAIALDLPVVLVVAIRLGCLNHALLTAKAISESGLQLKGWVANRMDPDCELQDENVAALSERLAAPLLADIDYAGDAALPDARAGKIKLDVS